jgi:Protein of unknown function (DUF3631)
VPNDPIKNPARPVQAVQGDSFVWLDPEPSPQSVSGEQLLNDLSARFTQYVVLPSGAADAMALWTLYTWTFDAFNVSPILAITSPVKRCGKTTVVTLLQALARRSLAASSITPAALFRFVEREQPTLIVDEADRFLLKSEELTGILNAGHVRATARVIRTSGEHHEPRSFSTWCPKAIAMIGRLEDTLQDRAIEVRMRRKTNSETTDLLRVDRVAGEVEDLRRQAVRWCADNAAAIAAADPPMPAHLHNRAQDNWRPLFAISQVAQGQWPERVQRAAEQLSQIADDQEDLGLLLLGDIRRVFNGRERVSSAELVHILQQDVEKPWSEWWQNGPREVAKLLRPFGIRSRKIRIGAAAPAQGYVQADFNDALRRYLPPEAEQTEQAEHGSEKAADIEKRGLSDIGSQLSGKEELSA